MKFSFNNRFIVEPYFSDRTLKATQGSGFAMVSQKVNLKGLKLLVDVRLFDSSFLERHVDGIGSTTPFNIPAGSTVYIREELLYTQPWAKQILECKDVDGKFIIIDKQYVEMIDLIEAK